LSVGEMQRTALARAMLNDPKVILADEPTGNLDPENAAIVLAAFAGFSAQGGTVLMVTHNPSDAAHASQQWRMSQGRVTQA
jgi:putative ABC transport system ATP-binding protein